MYSFEGESIITDFTKFKFDYNAPLEKQSFYVKHGDTGIGGPGDLVLIFGREKSRKTTALDCISYSNYTEDTDKTLGFKTDIGNRKHLIAIDTESSVNQFQMMRKKFCDGTGYKSNIPTYHPYLIRKLDFREKIRFLKDLISNIYSKGEEIGIIALDQLGDFVSNVNDDSTVNSLVDYLLEIAEEKKLLIIGCLHSNRGGEDTLGKLGARLDKKCTSSFKVDYDPESNVSCMQQVRSRNKPLRDKLCFKHNEYGYPQLVEEFNL